MAVSGDTGNGATLTLALFDAAGDAISPTVELRSIDAGETSSPPINADTLGDSKEQSLPGDVAQFAECSATFKWLSEEEAPALPTVAGTFTITWPQRAGETAAQTQSGTGVLTRFKPPSFENGELQEGELSWKWDGDTGPAFTAATTA